MLAATGPDAKTARLGASVDAAAPDAGGARCVYLETGHPIVSAVGARGPWSELAVEGTGVARVANLPTWALSHRGFLPSRDPLSELPRTHGAWEELGRGLPKLLVAGTARRAIEKLPLLTTETLGEEEHERAMLLLGYIAQASIWGARRAPLSSIPRAVAIPLSQVATRLQRPPIIAYASLVLYNWRRLDPNAPPVLGNLAILQNFLGGLDEDWFVQVHVHCETVTAPAVEAAMALPAAIHADDASSVIAHLRAIGDAQEQVALTLDRLAENCDPEIFFARVKPYLHGFDAHPVVYEGVAAYGEAPQRFSGATGAQTAIFALFDALLGIQQQDDPMWRHLRRLRASMPVAHAAFLERVESQPSVRAFIHPRRKTYPALVETYNRCIDWVEHFRRQHLRVAASYIEKPAMRTAHPREGGSSSPHRGSGGTPYLQFLKAHLDRTAASRL